MSLNKGKTSSQSQSTSSQAYDPSLTQPLLNNVAQANQVVQNNPYQAYSGAPLNIDDSAAQGVSSYQAPTVTAGQLANTNLQPYMNPFTSSVIDTSNAQLNKQQQIQQQLNKGQAIAASAFGGDGQAVLQSLTANDYAQQQAQMISGLNSQNFTQAQAGATGDLNRTLAADQGNQSSSIAAANARLAANAQMSADQQAQYSAGWNQYLNQQQYPFMAQQSVDQAAGLLPTSPLTTSQSTGSQSGFNMGFSTMPAAPKAA